MAVEASRGGAASPSGDLLKHAELEAKERGMGGDFEHIACRDGGDYDINGTEGSFVMVKSGAESDGKSDSSEKEIELDVGASVGDPRDLTGPQPSVTDCDSSAVVDYVGGVRSRNEYDVGREGKGGEVVGKRERKEEDSSYSDNKEKVQEMRDGGGQMQVSVVMHVTREDVIVDSIRTDHALKEGDVVREISTEVLKQDLEVLALEDLTDERGTVIDDLIEGEGVKVDDLKNTEDVMVVESSDDKEEVVSEDLDNEKEAVTGVPELVSEGTDASYVQNEVEISCEGQNISLASSQINSSDAINAEHKLKSVLDKVRNVEASDIQPGSKGFQVVFEIQEGKKVNGERSGDAELSTIGSKEGSAPEIKKIRIANDELGKDIVSSFTESVKEEKLFSELEDEWKITDGESEVFKFSITELTKDEASDEAESSITDRMVQIGIDSPNGARNTANSNLIGYDHGENERKSAIQEDEKQQSKALQIESDSIHDKGDGSCLDLIARHEKENISSSSIVYCQVAETSSIGPSKSSINKAINLASRADDKHAEAFSHNNQQSRDAPTNSACVDADLRSSVEQIQQKVIDTFLSKSEHDSSIELAAETIKEKNCSSSMLEEYQVVGASSIDRSTESVDHDVDIASLVENKHVEALSFENKQRKSAREFDSVDKNLMQGIDTSFTNYSSKENAGASSIVEKSMVAVNSSVGQCLVSVIKGVSLASLEEDIPEAMPSADQKIKNLSMDSENVDRGLSSYVEQVEQQQDVEASLSEFVVEEKGHDSSNESIFEPVKESIAFSIFETSQVVEVLPNDQCPDRVNEDVSLVSRAKVKNIEPLSLVNHQSKDSQTDSGTVNMNLKIPVEHLQHVDASLSNTAIEEKEHDSYIDLIAESAKENVGSFAVGDNLVVEASTISHGPKTIIDDSLDSRVEDKLMETLSTHNLQSKALPIDSGSEDRDLRPSVKRVQHQAVDISLTNPSTEEKHNNSTELIAESFKENIGSSLIDDEYLVAGASSIAQSPDSFNYSSNLVSQVEDKQVEILSMENQHTNSLLTGSDKYHVDPCLSNSYIEEKEPDSCMELISGPVKENNDSTSVIDKYHVVDSSFGQIPENVENISLASQADDKHVENFSIKGNLVPSGEELVSLAETDGNQNDEKPFIYLKPEPNDSEPFIAMSVSEQIELQPAADIAGLEAEHVEDLKGMNNKLSVEHSSEDIVAECNIKGEFESATVIEESLEIHIDKDLGAIKEQQEELKSEKQQASVHVEQHRASSAPLPSDVDGEKTEFHAKKYYIVKIPRFTRRVIDSELQQKIYEAQMKVDENTRGRDSVKAELENMRKVLSDCCHKKDSAIEEEKKARILVNTVRQEMDSLQSVVSKGKAASSFLDITSQIHTLSHKIQHQTISLKEEKKSIHELKQLEIEKEQHVFYKCSESEIDDALNKKEKAESSLQSLKKEFDLLRSAHLKADEIAKSASKNYINQFSKVKEHEKKWRTANELRQTAYKDLLGLKSDKMDHFWRYMDDKQVARKYASSGDLDALERHCTGQIERILQLWKEEEDFRRQYIESNVNSTLRRFGTLDGRTVGLNEETFVLPNRIPPPLSTRNLPIHVKVHGEELGASQKNNRPALQPKKMVRSKPSSKSTAIESPPAIVSVKEEIVEVEVERSPREEEAQVAQVRLEEVQESKEEESRREKEALELKEKIRMEQKIKAKEAEERKRRKSEKARARADFKAQKEAELREQKKAKKEKKKEDFSETNGSMEGENISVTEMSSSGTSQEPEKSSKRPARLSAAALNRYSNRAQPVPLPLRNKRKRKTSMFMWALCGAAAVGGLLFAGTYISSNISFLEFGF